MAEPETEGGPRLSSVRSKRRYVMEERSVARQVNQERVVVLGMGGGR